MGKWKRWPYITAPKRKQISFWRRGDFSTADALYTHPNIPIPLRSKIISHSPSHLRSEGIEILDAVGCLLTHQPNGASLFQGQTFKLQHMMQIRFFTYECMWLHFVPL